MADIFISYANEDRESAAQLARTLETAGWRVWWDRRIPAGRTWRVVLEDALREMRCMVVLWSENSVQSPWVAEEAEEARRLGKMIVPVLIQRVEPPIGFRAIQAADLTKWDGSIDDPAAQLFLADLKSVLGGAPDKPVRPNNDDIEVRRTDRNSSPTSVGQRQKAIFAALGIVVAVWAAWQLWPNSRQLDLKPPANEKSEKPPAPSLVSVVIDGAGKELKPSETMRLALSGKYSDGTQTQIKDGIEWSSSAPQVAVVSADGEVKGIKAGSSDIKAKIGGVASAGWTVSVKAAKTEAKPAPAVRLVALRVSSSSRELLTREKTAIRVRGRYSDNTEQNLASGFEWQISDQSIASVNRDGELEARRPGKVEIIARAGELHSTPLTVVVKEAPKIAPPAVQPAKPLEAPPPRAPAVTEQAKARIVAHINRAASYREEGNYAAALAELERAKAMDALNDEIRKEIDQTKRACNAERVLGNKPNC